MFAGTGKSGENAKTSASRIFVARHWLLLFSSQAVGLCPITAAQWQSILKTREALLLTPIRRPLAISFRFFRSGFRQSRCPAGLREYSRGGTKHRPLAICLHADNVLGKHCAKLGLLVLPEGEGITHNCGRLFLDPLGRIFWQFDGNTGRLSN